MKTFAEILADQDRRLEAALEQLKTREQIPEALVKELFEELETLRSPQPSVAVPLNHAVRA
jgi:hypothetical protein